MQPTPVGEAGGSKGQGQPGRRGIARPAQAQRGRWGRPAWVVPPGASPLTDARGWPL